MVSVAVIPSAADAAALHLQDWRGWIDRGLVDVLCPMAYTTDAAAFAAEIEAVRAAAGRHPVWAGIGAYRLSADQIAENVRSARRIGVRGVALFSYDSLVDAARGPEFLLQVARAAFNRVIGWAFRPSTTWCWRSYLVGITIFGSRFR